MTAATLLLPAPDAAWRVWKPRGKSSDEAVDSPAEASHLAKPLLIGLPASACRTIGMIVPQADIDLLEQIITTNLERRGLKLDHDAAGKNFRWHLLGQSAGQSIISVDILADPFPEALAAAEASDYTAALRLAQLPAGHLVVTEEQGDVVLAASHLGKLYHSHIFAQTPAGEDALALEITLARLAIEAELGEGCISGIALVGAGFDKAIADRLGQALDLPARVVAELPPSADLDTKGWTKLLPASVRAAQTARATRSKVVRWATLGVLLYLAVGFLAWTWLTMQERRVQELQAEVDDISEPAAAVKKTSERWKAYAAAVEHERYPMFLLAEITRLMPPSGVVIRRFEVNGNNVEVRGEARDAQLAFQFIEDFKKNKVLSRYTWTNPRPEVKGTTATFRAQGKLP
ncbi:MAG: hypothetical protein HS117_26595 [Verrucomicrobiaceae bacterium]|jgi:hypothetical protein|nr:hypothetical protein [Verrucomicrobiaceae bacterium]